MSPLPRPHRACPSAHSPWRPGRARSGRQEKTTEDGRRTEDGRGRRVTGRQFKASENAILARTQTGTSRGKAQILDPFLQISQIAHTGRENRPDSQNSALRESVQVLRVVILDLQPCGRGEPPRRGRLELEIRPPLRGGSTSRFSWLHQTNAERARRRRAGEFSVSVTYIRKGN